MKDDWQKANDLICQSLANILRFNQENDERVIVSIRSHVWWVEISTMDFQETALFSYLDFDKKINLEPLESLLRISKDPLTFLKSIPEGELHYEH